MPIVSDPIKNVLGLKALAWDYRSGQFVSPARPDFVWSPGGLQASNCKLYEKHELLPGEVDCVPYWKCTCGLYTSHAIEIIDEYTHTSPVSPILLVEASGKNIRHELGFRSAELTIRMVGMREGTEGILKLATYQAADYFQVEIHPLEELQLMMDLHNIRLYQSHPVPYRPFSPMLRKIPYDHLLKQINARKATV